MGQGLLLHPPDAGLKLRLLPGGLHVLPADVLDGAGEEAARAAGGVEDGFPEAGVDHVHRELRDGPGRVVLPGVSGSLEVLEDPFVEVSEQVPAGGVVEVDVGLDLVDDLP